MQSSNSDRIINFQLGNLLANNRPDVAEKSFGKLFTLCFAKF